MTTRGRSTAGAITLAGLVCLLAGCDSSAGEGTLRVNVYGEEFVEAGIPADEFVDGWSVTFSKFLVSVSDIEADGVEVGGAGVYDLAVASAGEGHEVGSALLPAGSVDRISYRVAPAGGEMAGNASAQDVTAMAADGHSLWVVGTATNDDVAIDFAWGFTTDTRYVDCSTDQPLANGGEATSQLTIHADHLLYDDLDSEEPNIAFDLIAQADADADAQVTEAEIRDVDITGQTRYQVGSRDVSDLWSFIEVQTTTVGHIDGEGHCAIEPAGG